MNTLGIKYEFDAITWKYVGPNSWVFISIPNNIAEEIRMHFKHEEKAWGRLPAKVQIGNSTWVSAIWFDTKMNTYLLPIKANIRKKEIIEIDKNVIVILWI